MVRIWAALAALVLGCGGNPETYGLLVIKEPTTWSNKTVVVTQEIQIVSGGELTLDHVTLQFAPQIEDTESLRIDGTGRLVARDSRLESASGQQWNLEAWGQSQLVFERTTATGHSGIRAHEQVTLDASAGDLEEVQVHDEAHVTLRDGAAAYVPLFFTGALSASLTAGELATGDAIQRTFTFPSGPTTVATVELAGASVYGWQLDLDGPAQLTIADADGVVLALHLLNTVQVVDQAITSDTRQSGQVDFSAQGGPRLAFANSQITSLNVYVDGASDLTFTGANDVTEPNAGGTSHVTFGPATRLWANLAQSYDDARMTFDGVTLLGTTTDDGSNPSFTAQDRSRIDLQNVAATANSRVYAVGAGQVQITGGSGWDRSMFEAIDPEGDGGVYVDGAKIVP